MTQAVHSMRRAICAHMRFPCVCRGISFFGRRGCMKIGSSGGVLFACVCPERRFDLA